jgi:hypothetical protein
VEVVEVVVERVVGKVKVDEVEEVDEVVEGRGPAAD